LEEKNQIDIQKEDVKEKEVSAFCNIKNTEAKGKNCKREEDHISQ